MRLMQAGSHQAAGMRINAATTARCRAAPATEQQARLTPDEVSLMKKFRYCGQANGIGSRKGCSPQLSAATIFALPGAMVRP